MPVSEPSSSPHIADARPSGVTPALARFAASTALSAMPGAVVMQAKQAVLDVLGIALAGAGVGEGCDAIAAYARSSGAGVATVWATGERLPPPNAALLNAAHARALDYDDIVDFPQVHVAVCVVPAVLAAAEASGKAVDGRRVLAAVVAGCEIQARLAAAIAPYFGQGLPTMLPTQLFGYFAAAAACARVLGLDAARMESALGLALMHAAGTEEMVVHAGESDGKCLYAALSNQAGLACALMAAHGVRARGEPIAGKAGLFAAFYDGAFDHAALVDALGERYVGLRRCLKTMPGTLVSHAFSEAASCLMREHAIAPEDIERVVLEVGPWGRAMCEPNAMRRRPPSASAAMNSIPFIVAKTIANGAVTLEDFGDAGRADARARAIAERIEHVLVERPGDPRSLEPGIVVMHRRDGRVHRARVDVPLGHPDRPVDFDAVARKFERNARHAPHPLDGAGIARVITLVDGLDRLDDIRPLIASLTPTPTEHA